jgi:pyruvate formate lyase activating enzyme
MESGMVFNIQRFSLHDGPGIRTTIFFKGCPLKCQWCQNPEGISASPLLLHYPNRCLGCSACIDICEQQAIVRDRSGVRIDRQECNLCLKCAAVCPVEAIQVAGKVVTVEELIIEALKDRLTFEESGGGVTISGGEPFMQPEFMIAVLKRLKYEGIHTVIETSGYAPWAIVEEAAKFIDLFIYDLKLIDSVSSEYYLGVQNSLMLDNLKRLQQSGANLQVRMPLIPQANDDQKNIKQTAKFLTECGITELELIAYHNLGSAKYAAIGLDYMQNAPEIPSKAFMGAIKQSFEKQGIKIISEVG